MCVHVFEGVEPDERLKGRQMSLGSVLQEELSSNCSRVWEGPGVSGCTEEPHWVLRGSFCPEGGGEEAPLGICLTSALCFQDTGSGDFHHSS